MAEPELEKMKAALKNLIEYAAAHTPGASVREAMRDVPEIAQAHALLVDTPVGPRHWRYQVPTTDGLSGWAIVSIDDDGAFSVVSDYGNFGYMWGRSGRADSSRDMRDEILRFGPDYILDKLSYGTGNVYDEEKTCIAIRKFIEEDLDGARQREELQILEDADLDNEHGFAEWCSNTSIPEPFLLGGYRRDNRDREAFMDRAWPRIRALIAAEVESERGVPPG